MADHKNPPPSQSNGGTALKRAGKLILGKGFSIVLFLCIAAIGVSVYVLFSGRDAQSEPELPKIPELPDIGLVTALPFSPDETDAPEQTVASQTLIPDVTSTSKPPETSATRIFYVRPLAGEVIRGYSASTPVYNPTMDDWRVHTGIDIAAEEGEAVCAVAAGTVCKVYTDYFKGNVVEIQHLDGRISVYCGLADHPSAAVGDTVTAGTVIGSVGAPSSFESLDGAHLHFEMLQDGTRLDPTLYLPS